MNRFNKYLQNLWKYSDWKKSQFELNFLAFFLLSIISRIVKILWRVINFKPGKYVYSIFGIYLKKRKEDFTYRFCVYGDCGSFLLTEIENISQPTVFLDVGANIGLFSILAAKNVNIEKVYAFEPDSSSLAFFIDNMKYNEVTKISLMPYALSDKEGVHKLFLEKGHSGAATLEESKISKEFLVIECVDNTFLDSNLVIEDYYDIFIKIDVEGHEARVLSAIAKWKYFNLVSKIFLEFDINMSNVSELNAFLRAQGFISKEKSGTNAHWDEIWVRK